MARRKLTNRQRRIANKIQQKRVSRLDDLPTKPETSLGPEQSGLVISSHGQYVIIQDEHLHLFSCTKRQHIGSIVCGDRVVWQLVSREEGIITARVPRTTVLERPVQKGPSKPIAANIDQVLVMVAPIPTLQKLLIDRYIVAAEAAGLEIAIVFNKIDLLKPAEREKLEQELAIYPQLGYSLLYFSTKTGEGGREIKSQLADKISILAGQSGVGKSSAIKYLLPNQDIEVGELSVGPKLGKHTTTASQLYNLPSGGAIIDSPGVRDFGLWQYAREIILQGFKEFRGALGNCKFSSCTHRHEPGCTIREGVQNDRFDKTRYENLLRILEGT